MEVLLSWHVAGSRHRVDIIEIFKLLKLFGLDVYGCYGYGDGMVMVWYGYGEIRYGMLRLTNLWLVLMSMVDIDEHTEQRMFSAKFKLMPDLKCLCMYMRMAKHTPT
jgi:hypothetical protein